MTLNRNKVFADAARRRKKSEREREPETGEMRPLVDVVALTTRYQSSLVLLGSNIKGDGGGVAATNLRATNCERGSQACA